MLSSMTTATYTAIAWEEIIPGVYQAELKDGMTAEIHTGFRDAWEIYDFEGGVIAEGYGQGVSGCKVNVERVLRDL